MNFNHRDFDFRFTQVEPPAIDLAATLAARYGAKYISVACEGKEILLHFGAYYRKARGPSVYDISRNYPFERPKLNHAFEEWYRNAKHALSASNDCSFRITASISAPIFNRSIKLPDISEYSEWLLQNSIKLSGVTNAHEWGTKSARLTYGCGDGLQLRSFDRAVPQEFERWLVAPAGVSARVHTNFIRRVVANENRFDVFSEHHQQPWRFALAIDGIEPVSTEPCTSQ